MSTQQEYEASVRAQCGPPDPLADLRDRLIRDQAALLEAKAAAHRGNATIWETHLDGQIAGLGLALRYIAEETQP